MMMDGATTGLLYNKDITLQDIQAIHFFDWGSTSFSSQGSEAHIGKSFSFTSLARPEFGNHMLIKFTWRRNDEPLGQVVVNLRQVLDDCPKQGCKGASGRVSVRLSEGGVFTGQAVLDIVVSRVPVNLSDNQATIPLNPTLLFTMGEVFIRKVLYRFFFRT